MESEALMAALGIDCSSREPVSFFNAKAREMTVLERLYRIALREYDETNDKYVDAVDFWQDMANQYGSDSQQAMNARILMVHANDRADAAEARKHDAWMKLNCPHTHTRRVEVPDSDPMNVCIVCGAAEDEYHSHIDTGCIIK